MKHGQNTTARPHIHGCIRRHRIAIHIFRIGHHHTVIRSLAQPVRIDFLDNAAGIGDHHAATRGRGRGDIFLVKCRGSRPALAIEGIGRHLISLLAFVHDIRHEGVALFIQLLLLSRIGPRFQEFHQNRRHYGFFVAGQLRPANHALAHFGFHGFCRGSRRVATPFEGVKLHFHILVLRQTVVNVVAARVLLALVFH